MQDPEIHAYARFQAARAAATDICELDVVTTLSTDPRTLRELWERPILRMPSEWLPTGTPTVEAPEPAPDEAPGSDFDLLDDLRTSKGQIRRQISALRNSSGLPYRELATRLDFLLDAFEEEGESWATESSDSLQEMLLFLRSAPHLRIPTITITPRATFRAQWSDDKDRHLAIDFLPDGQARFVVFSPDLLHAGRVQRVSGIVSRADVMRVVKPYNVDRWAADVGT